MSRAIEVHPAVVDLTRLYAPERLRNRASPHDLLAQVEAGAAALAARTARWADSVPDSVDLAEAERSAAGLARLLGELRHHVEGPPDAA